MNGQTGAVKVGQKCPELLPNWSNSFSQLMRPECHRYLSATTPTAKVMASLLDPIQLLSSQIMPSKVQCSRSFHWCRVVHLRALKCRWKNALVGDLVGRHAIIPRDRNPGQSEHSIAFWWTAKSRGRSDGILHFNYIRVGGWCPQ